MWASAKEPEIKKIKEICFCLMFGKSQRWGERRDTERMSACMHASVPGHQLCEGR